MSLLPKNAEVKTPMQNAVRSIRAAWIAAFVQSALTIGAIAFAFAPTYLIVDVVAAIAMAVLLITIKSRIAAIALLALHVFGLIMSLLEGSVGNILVPIAFAIAYAGGVMGTFSYQKIKKQEKAAAYESTGQYGYNGYTGQYGAAGQGNIDPRFVPPPTQPIKEDTSEGKIILSHTHENLEIALKRTSGTTDLVINGMVYAQKESMIDINYELSVCVENTFVKIHRDNLGGAYLYINNNLAASSAAKL